MKNVELTLEEYETIYTSLLFEKLRNENNKDVLEKIEKAIDAIRKAL